MNRRNNDNTRGLVATIAGFAALGLILLSLFYWAAVLNPPFSLSNVDLTLKILAISGIVCFAIYILFAPESVGKTVGKRSTRLTANALVASIVAIAIGIVINIIMDNVPSTRVHLVAGKDLAPQTVKLLNDLAHSDRRIDVIGFFYRENPQQASDLLAEYGSYTTRFRYQIKDPVREPLLANQYGITQDGVVVFTDGKKREVAREVNEREFTSAIVRLLQTDTKKVAFLTGHGERDINGVDERGYSQLNESLKRDNYVTVQWSLATTPTIPITDVTVLVIADPQEPLNQKEIDSVNAYLDGGGHVLLALDQSRNADDVQKHAQVLASLEKISSRYGVTARDGFVVDYARLTDFAPQAPVIFTVSNFPSQSDITAGLGNLNPAFLGAIAIIPPPPTSTITSTQATTLLQTSGGPPDSWLEVIPPGGQPNLQYDQGTSEIAGPIVLGLSIEPTGETEPAEDISQQKPQTRLVIFGDADFAGNLFLTPSQDTPYRPQNGDLFSNAVSWLAGVNELVSVRPQAPDTPRTFIMDAAKKNVQLVTAVFGLPILVLLVGGAVWWRRK